MRVDGREPNQIREVKVTTNFVDYAEGSVLIELGKTRVICTASVENKVPMFLKDAGQGWVTAEYSMLPRATQVRTIRDISAGKVSGRSNEIQRLIGRSLRTVVDLNVLSNRTIWIDCDVVQADGGTRTAGVTGGYIALVLACKNLLETNKINKMPITNFLAATSVGIVEGREVLDLSYLEDSTAEVDMNVVMIEGGNIVELQGTAEGNPFSREQMDRLLNLAEEGVNKLIQIEKEVLKIDKFE
jgi:ribonuclease PH